MPIGSNINRSIALKAQSGLGVKAPAGAGGTFKYLRRTEFTGNLAKESYQSQEVLTSQQIRDMRHGLRSGAGGLRGELSAGAYQPIFEQLLRQDVQTAVTTGALTNVTAASSGAGTGAGTYTRAAGSFITDGFKVGDLINWTGWATTGVPSNNHTAMITALSATVMTVRNLDGVDVGAKASGDSVTGVTLGKKTWVPQTGQTRKYFTLEDWKSDVSRSRTFTDTVFTGANIALPPSGLATVEFPLMSLDVQFAGAQYATSPAAAATGGIAAAVNGAMLVQGSLVGLVTGLTINIAGGYSVPGGVVGKNVDPDIFPGTFTVGGSASVLLQDGTFSDFFNNETEVSIAVALSVGGLANSDAIGIVMPRVKFAAADENDATNGIAMDMPFTALENVNNASGTLATTISIQDTLFA